MLLGNTKVILLPNLFSNKFMLLDLSILELSKGLKSKKFSSAEIVEECYQNIEKINPQLNAFVTLVPKEEVIKKAEEADKSRSAESSIIFGLPFIIKDCFNTKGIKTTASSAVLENYFPPYNATVYQKVLDEGGILIGKTNMDAWGHGASSENTDFGVVRNPWDLSRVAGGSSGGNAAAISSRMAVFGIGEDTGGSIRNPCCWCNITGLKVTYGRVSRYGCIAYVSSFDTVGPMAKSVEDIACVLKIIAGKDPLDATSSPEKVPDYQNALQKKLNKIILGVPKECFSRGLDKEVKDLFEKSIQIFSEIGFSIKEISIPLLDYGVAIYYLIGTSETSANLARYDGIRYGKNRSYFSRETMRRIMLGTYALSAGYYNAYYKKAQQGRTLLIKEYNKAFSKCDALLMPVEPMPATKIGQLINNPLQNMLADIYTCQTPAGIPSLAIPCGFTKDQLPVGVQLLGKMFSEPLLLQIGYAYQKVTNFHKRKPEILID